MSNRIAEFQKVSYEQFKKDWIDTFPIAQYAEESYFQEIYDNIRIPERATRGSAGYDFFSPKNFVLAPGEEIKIPTGIRVKMEENWVLMVYPRSSIGFKYFTVLKNTTGVIDSSYYFAENEGHMFMALHNLGNKPLAINTGDRICQGVFLPYGITIDDHVEADRTGGLGSTGR